MFTTLTLLSSWFCKSPISWRCLSFSCSNIISASRLTLKGWTSSEPIPAKSQDGHRVSFCLFLCKMSMFGLLPWTDVVVALQGLHVLPGSDSMPGLLLSSSSERGLWQVKLTRPWLWNSCNSDCSSSIRSCSSYQVRELRVKRLHGGEGNMTNTTYMDLHELEIWKKAGSLWFRCNYPVLSFVASA